jgi:rhodanese-related sulfurtransferase
MKKLIAMILTALSLNAYSTDPKTAYDMVQKGEAVIIDVREEDEIKSGMIKNAKWFPLSKITKDKTWKEDFKQLVGDKTIFLHCRSGARSEKAMNILKENGITSENIGGYESLKKILPVRELGIR